MINLTSSEIEELQTDKRQITERTPEIMAAFEDAQEDRPMIEPISSNWMEADQ